MEGLGLAPASDSAGPRRRMMGCGIGEVDELKAEVLLTKVDDSRYLRRGREPSPVLCVKDVLNLFRRDRREELAERRKHVGHVRPAREGRVLTGLVAELPIDVIGRDREPTVPPTRGSNRRRDLFLFLVQLPQGQHIDYLDKKPVFYERPVGSLAIDLLLVPEVVPAAADLCAQE